MKIQQAITSIRTHLGILACIVVSIYYIYSTFSLEPWKHKKIIDQDVIMYYGYVPATFIYHDWSFRFPSQPGFKGTVWNIPLPNGKSIQKMTMGTAMLYTPFFAVAHLITKATGGLADGYSEYYQRALIWAGVFYSIMGIFLLRNSLSRFFNERVTAWVALVLCLGTNLFNYSVWEGALSHVYSFFLFALSLYLFLKWIDKPTLIRSLFLGSAAGLIVLVRPTNAVFLLFPIIYFFTRQTPDKQKSAFLLKQWWKLLLMAIAAIGVCVPQMIYWKMNTGHYIFYSYLGEPFYFNNPQLVNGLLSYNKGWLVYTPIMWLGILGFGLMRPKYSAWFWPSLVTMCVSIYIIFSWWCWWYGGSFSARSLVEYYVVMAFPLGAFFSFILQKKWWIQGTIALVVVMLIYLNFYQQRQYRSSLLHWDSMSKAAYWGIWGRQSWPENYEQMLIHLDADKARRGEDAYPN